MTFSIVGRSPDGLELGVAVASKFLAVGAYVPAAASDAGALATQAYGNMALRTDGLKLLRAGVTAEGLLSEYLDEDPKREERQVGVVDGRGRAATYTGSRNLPWAGGNCGQGPEGSFAAQGNALAGPAVIDEMVRNWLGHSENSLARRLLDALAAGQAAGGDPRGKQAAALLVVSPGAGYGGLTDVKVDLRSDDSPEPILELERMLALHDLYFGRTPDDQLLPLRDDLTLELQHRLAALGFSSGDLPRDLYNWMGRENFEERWHDGMIDPVVLEQVRIASPTVAKR
jgi:uncharacterized Ntn-hydrolase superfamily protein